MVPYIPDYLSLSGLNIFARQLRKFQESVVAHDPKMSEPKIRAVIVNRFKAVGNVFSEAIVTLKGQLGFLRQAHSVAVSQENTRTGRFALRGRYTEIHVKVALRRADPR